MLFLSTLGISAWSEQDSRFIFDHFDESGDGEIDLKEFEDKMLQLSQVAKQKKGQVLQSRPHPCRRKYTFCFAGCPQ
jgi:hypothetical protein